MEMVFQLTFKTVSFMSTVVISNYPTLKYYGMIFFPSNTGSFFQGNTIDSLSTVAESLLVDT